MSRFPVMASLLAVFVAGILLSEALGYQGAAVAQRSAMRGRFDVEVDDGGVASARSVRYRVTERTSGDDYLLYTLQEGFLPGDVLTVEGVRFAMPDTLDGYGRYLLRHGMRGRIYARTVTRCDTTGAQATWLNRVRRWAYTVRAHCRRRLQTAGLDGDDAALALGILVGDKSAMTPHAVADFRGAGMSHLLAVSGMHIGILFAIVMLLLRPLRLVQMDVLGHAVALALLWGYVLLVGCPPSAVRAAIMLMLVVLSRLAGGDAWGWHNLCVAALAMLVYDTQLVYDTGFQLSMLATAGILAFRPVLEGTGEKRGFLDSVRRLFFLTFSAQLFTLPVVAYVFHQVPLLGFVQGILVVPVLPFYVVILLVVLAFPGATAVAWVAGLTGRYVMGVASYVNAAELWLLGGRPLWYPSEVEAFAMLTITVVAVAFWRWLIGRSR